MLLAIDIGNSNIVWGLFRQQELIGSWRMETALSQTAEAYGDSLSRQLDTARQSIAAITDTIICSVVPILTPVFERVTQDLLQHRPLVVSSCMDTGLVVRYADPRTLGADRLVNAVAAYDRHKTNIIVIDLGTATTFSVVTQKGEFLGGAIAPGLGISAEALSAKTAQLPKAFLAPPQSVIGRDTLANIQSGLIYGHAAMVDELTARLQEELGQEAMAVATGGFSSIIALYCKRIHEVRPHLTLEGLELLYRRHKGESQA
ncbi:MAG: type III pantothenate kinase [Nitrospirota bacterium]|nr:type III pantothenate kinase [Nitrospirota bacterium]